MINHLKWLVRYKTWANGRLYDTLAGAPDTVLDAPRAIVFGSVLRTLNHATYHRGHIADMMYQPGITPPTTDLPVFRARCGN